MIVMNGGKVARTTNGIYITDVISYKSTYQLDESLNIVSIYQDVWESMVYMDGKVYFVNRSDNDFIYVYDEFSKSQTIVVKEASSKLAIADDMLYYLSEEKEELRSYNISTGRTQSIERNVKDFSLLEDSIVVWNAKGIDSIELVNGRRTSLLEGDFLKVDFMGSTFIYTKMSELETTYIARYDNPSNATKIEHMADSVSFARDYIYLTDGNHDHSIYRMDQQLYSSFRFHGESSSCLTCVDNDLFFVSEAFWYKLNLDTNHLDRIDGIGVEVNGY